MKKEKGMIVKLDMANAFNRINLGFLVAILQRFGFSKKVIDIIKACIACPWIAPLVNGRPSEYFQSSMGLRQGCPLSSFLYIIMADSSSRSLDKCRQYRTITGFSISPEVKSINHSLFADDTLVMGGPSYIMARRIKKVLRNFLESSRGLLYNNKCIIYGWNTPSHTLQKISEILEIPFQEKWSHFQYLGLPISKENLKTEIWNKYIEKMKQKVQNWGMILAQYGRKGGTNKGPTQLRSNTSPSKYTQTN